MKTYISSIIPRIQKYSKRLDDLSMLTGQQWTLIDEETKDRTVYIFKDDGRLLISHNGKITKATWEYLGDNSLMIDKEDESFLFRQGFFDDKVMALQLDNSQEYAFMVNEIKLQKRPQTLESVSKYLDANYLNSYEFDRIDVRQSPNSNPEGKTAEGVSGENNNIDEDGQKDEYLEGVKVLGETKTWGAIFLLLFLITFLIGFVF